jgi:superfamily I DNA/RNA helicase
MLRRDVLAYLRLVANPMDELALLRVINTPPRGVGTSTVEKALAVAAEKRLPLAAGRRIPARRRVPGSAARLRGFRAAVSRHA